MKTLITALIFLFCSLNHLPGQVFDTTGLNRLRTAAAHSQPHLKVEKLCIQMPHRLNGSDGLKAAFTMLKDSLMRDGFDKVHTETFTRSFKNWRATNFKANLVKPWFMPLVAQPRPYTCATRGIISGQLVYLGTMKMDKIKLLAGSLAGKMVLFDPLIKAQTGKGSFFDRHSDSTLKAWNNQPVPDTGAIKKRVDEQQKFYARLKKYYARQAEIVNFLEDEGAAALIFGGLESYGIIKVMNALTSRQPDDPFDTFSYAAYSGNVVKIPQIVISEDQYRQLVGLAQEEREARVELSVEVDEGMPNAGENLLAEITGTEKPGEIVLFGAHLDAYPAGTGAADNMAGVVTIVEALKILKNSGYRPAKTIRIGIWGGEELGMLGSDEYASTHFVKETGERLHVYLNTDFGAGAYRGIYAQEDAKAHAAFKALVKWVNDPRFQTVSPEYAADSDHISFSDKGLPGYHLIQDPLDYKTIFHSNMDIAGRISPDDLQYNVKIMAMLMFLLSQ